jgi:hypothetical protein
MITAAELAFRLFNPIDVDSRMVMHHAVRIETLAPSFEGSFKRVPVRVNEFGHRIPSRWEKRYGHEKPHGAKRVLVFGDSFTFGDEWPAEDSFVEQLQQRLDPTFSRVQVLNFGVPGYNPYQELNYIKESALAFQPDVVVVAFTESNDLVPIEETLGRWGRFQTLKTWLRRNLYLYSVGWDVWYHGRNSALGRALWSLAGAGPTGAPVLSAPLPEGVFRQRVMEIAAEYYGNRRALIEREAPGWRQAYASYKEMAAFLEARDVPFVIVALTVPWDVDCGAWRCAGVTLRYGDVLEPGREFATLLAARLGRLTPHYVAIDSVFAPYTLEALHEAGRGHYGPRKNRLVAERLVTTLVAIGIVAAQ